MTINPWKGLCGCGVFIAIVMMHPSQAASITLIDYGTRPGSVSNVGRGSAQVSTGQLANPTLAGGVITVDLRMTNNTGQGSIVLSNPAGVTVASMQGMSTTGHIGATGTDINGDTVAVTYAWNGAGYDQGVILPPASNPGFESQPTTAPRVASSATVVVYTTGTFVTGTNGQLAPSSPLTVGSDVRTISDDGTLYAGRLSESDGTTSPILWRNDISYDILNHTSDVSTVRILRPDGLMAGGTDNGLAVLWDTTTLAEKFVSLEGGGFVTGEWTQSTDSGFWFSESGALDWVFFDDGTTAWDYAIAFDAAFLFDQFGLTVSPVDRIYSALDLLNGNVHVNWTGSDYGLSVDRQSLFDAGAGIVVPVPEPGYLAAMGLGALWLWQARRSRARASS